ncbi:MAG: hypothetical protein V2A70_10300 [Candidatus Omnitrophota bacterium]
MLTLKNPELLKNEEVKKEIERFKWIESEKAGLDIGFEKASREWLDRFSKTWMDNHPGYSKKPSRSAKRVTK